MLNESGNPEHGELFTRVGHDSVRTLMPLDDGWLAAGQSSDNDVGLGDEQSWLFRFGDDRALEFTQDSGIQRQELLPSVEKLESDIEDVDVVTEVFGAEPTSEQFEARDVTFSIRREEQF